MMLFTDPIDNELELRLLEPLHVEEVNRIDIMADARNAPSRAVAQRLGFTHEACLAQWLRFPDGSYRDMASYRPLREDWEAGGS